MFQLNRQEMIAHLRKQFKLSELHLISRITNSYRNVVIHYADVMTSPVALDEAIEQMKENIAIDPSEADLMSRREYRAGCIAGALMLRDMLLADLNNTAYDFLEAFQEGVSCG